MTSPEVAGRLTAGSRRPGRWSAAPSSKGWGRLSDRTGGSWPEGADTSAALLEVGGAVGPQLAEPVVALDQPDRAALRPHDQGVRAGAARAVPDAAQQLAVGDPGGHEEDVVAADEIIRVQHPVEVVPGVGRLGAFGIVPWPQPALDGAAEALDGA